MSQNEADTIKCNLPLCDCVKNIDLFVFCIQVAYSKVLQKISQPKNV